MDENALAQRPAIDAMDERTLDLIRKTVAPGASNADVGLFLQLAGTYELDPFAREIWCVRSPGRDGSEGRLLVMIGRDGLRKIAQRNGIHIDGDVVHENDDFSVTRTGDGRTVTHSYGKPSDRGAIVGAWAQCRGKDGSSKGYFYAAMDEYRPTSDAKLRFSPWGSQAAVMILAAAERQALRQATPLSGLLIEGELDLNEERAAAPPPTEAPDALDNAIDTAIADADLAAQAKSLIAEQNELAPHSWTVSKVEMVFGGQDEATVRQEIEFLVHANKALQPADAEVVDDPIVIEPDGF